MAAQATYVLTAGGTGGHLFPAQALAERLAARGHRLALMTDERGTAYASRFPDAEIIAVPSASPSGGLGAKFRAALLLGRGAMKASKTLRLLDPAAVVGFGGYASFPALWAAGRQHRPILLHEQNAHLGRANRLFGRRAAGLALSFEQTRAMDAASGAPSAVTGNPVREAILAVRQQPYDAPGHDGPLRVLIIGGSQGASVFADTVPEAIAGLPERLRDRVSVTQQVRSEQMDAVRATYDEAGIEAELAPFFDDMQALLSRAHLVVARAGASTVAELTVAGRPAVLVPYPHAADDHQTANAEALVAAGAAWLIPNAKFDAATCRRTLEALLEDPEALKRMAAESFALGRPDAADRLADFVERRGAVA
ncbi:MAG: undecaprenyldiphospho-muramoylpentapeptide beta-N-acetylglucosaminyltransferase [Minwuia sp.]|uniref:undecaprenyldiphospho-muramoylpentapeptide beta-N-acetylglucosaminyltransferase n=1 Tax=Minwuia sp. TaxID=2493630 RepID=UPI003A86ED6E